MSVDNFNRGIGFGSFGALPGTPQFANIQPVYPYALTYSPTLPGAELISLATYDLRTDFSIAAWGSVLALLALPPWHFRPLQVICS